MDSCRSATVTHGIGAITASGRKLHHHNSISEDGQPAQGATAAFVVGETTCCAYPTCCLDVAAPLCAGIAVLATAPLECRGEHAGGDHRPRRLGHMGVQAGRRDERRRCCPNR